jgi:hypothetical protein
MEAEEDDYAVIDTVASCPITPSLVDQIVALADLPIDDEKAAKKAIKGFGWSTKGLEVDEALFRTNEGHLVYGSDTYFMPFAYIYAVGTEIMEDDFWGELPGWSSRSAAGPDEFHAVRDAAVAVFAERLGPPEVDVRTDGAAKWRFAAWRRGGNAIVVGQDLDAFSYSQIEECVVHIGEHPADAPFPEAAEFESFIGWSA